jgi:PAS domain S-box-containing protein
MANGGIAGLRIDISRLKAVEAALVAREEELHRSQAHLNEAQRLGGIGSYERRVDGSWMWSREMYRIFALDPETFVLTDETQLALIHPDDRAELLSARRRVITEGGPHEAEYRIVRADGETRTVYNRVVTLHDPAGAIVGTFGTIQDVTDIRRVERQLVQAQKMEAIGNLTGGVAHDFNNLLTVILGNAELLSSSVTGADAELVQECALAARRGAELASSLLSFARRQVLRPAALDVNDLVGQAVSLMRRTLGEDIAIDVQLPAGTPCVVADAAQLESALLNLAINARDAMPGGGRLTLTVGEIALDAAAAARREIAAGTYVEIALTDTGAGMSSEIAAKAFEPFFTTKGVGKGSGLGLSMVYGFAKQSGGHAAIDSALGRGTVVRLLLPAARRRQPAGEATPRAGVPPRGRGEIVLVVEDNELVRHMVVRQIERLGYRVEAAVDAASALDKLRAQPVDLIFTDIVMPGGSGFDLAAEAARAQPGVRILFTSGYSDHAVNARGRFGAGARLIAKPYDVRELARHLREMLDTPR